MHTDEVGLIFDSSTSVCILKFECCNNMWVSITINLEIVQFSLESFWNLYNNIFRYFIQPVLDTGSRSAQLFPWQILLERPVRLCYSRRSVNSTVLRYRHEDNIYMKTHATMISLVWLFLDSIQTLLTLVVMQHYRILKKCRQLFWDVMVILYTSRWGRRTYQI